MLFCQMGLVESWGTGIRRIREAAAKYGLPEPEFQVFDNMFRVNLFRDNSLISNLEFGRETSEKHRRNFGENLNNTRRKFLLCLQRMQVCQRQIWRGRLELQAGV